jgi:hypothetical protein
MDEAFDIVADFLTGAYRRHTKTKPLRDVDIMIVLRDTSYLAMHPREILEQVRKALAVHYGEARVRTDRRAVRVDFGTEHMDDLAGGWPDPARVGPDISDVLEMAGAILSAREPCRGHLRLTLAVAATLPWTCV